MGGSTAIPGFSRFVSISKIPIILRQSTLVPSFAITDEIYQFRDFSRDRVRVLMTLDTSSVDGECAGSESNG